MRKVLNPFWLKTCGNQDVPQEKLEKGNIYQYFVQYLKFGKQIVDEIQYGLFAKPIYDDI